MVDCQSTLCNVHGPRMDQPDLHLWTLALGDRVPRQLSHLPKESGNRRIQPRSSRLHNVPCRDMVLPPRRDLTNQDWKEQDQALASTRPQPRTSHRSLLPCDLAAGPKMKVETHKVARLHAILWGIFSLGGMVAAFLLPVLIYLTAIAYPFSLWPFNGTKDPSFLITGHRLGALFIFVTIAGSLYHGIFRFQSALTEVGLLKYRRALEAIGYFIIFVGIIVLAYYLATWYLNGTIS